MSDPGLVLVLGPGTVATIAGAWWAWRRWQLRSERRQRRLTAMRAAADREQSSDAMLPARGPGTDPSASSEERDSPG